MNENFTSSDDQGTAVCAHTRETRYAAHTREPTVNARVDIPTRQQNPRD